MSTHRPTPPLSLLTALALAQHYANVALVTFVTFPIASVALVTFVTAVTAIATNVGKDWPARVPT